MGGREGDKVVARGRIKEVERKEGRRSKREGGNKQPE